MDALDGMKLQGYQSLPSFEPRFNVWPHELKTTERNLKHGRRQAGNIMFDSRRMIKLPDEAIEREEHVQNNAFNRHC